MISPEKAEQIAVEIVDIALRRTTRAILGAVAVSIVTGLLNVALLVTVLIVK